MTKEQLRDDLGPDGVFVFYSFLVSERDGNITIFGKVALRSVFVAEYRKLKESHKHLEKEVFKRAFTKDLILSYLYLKDKYFEMKK